MKNILFFSPDLNLCASLLMFFNDKYSVTTTTDFESLKNIIKNSPCDLLVIDAEPTQRIETFCREINEQRDHIPIILTYVFTIKYKDRESSLKKFIDAIFYKPIDLIEVSQKIDRLMVKFT